MAKKVKQPKQTRVPTYVEFCVEMDLFSESGLFPEWVEEYRDRLLTKLNTKLIKFCRKLKASKIAFNIMYPMEINRKWKFADVYIPSKRTVVMLNTAPHPAAWLSQRASFFTDRCKVYELDGYESDEEIQNLINKLK